MLRKAKKRQYLAKNAESVREKQRLASIKAKGKAEVGKLVDYISPEKIVKEYREKQKSYSIYKRAVFLEN
jgi:hypothetical protein